jgi:hypothetical protein
MAIAQATIEAEVLMILKSDPPARADGGKGPHIDPKGRQALGSRAMEPRP